MRARNTLTTGSRLPAQYLDPAGGYAADTIFPLRTGKDYLVYAVTIRRGGVWYYVLDESGVEYPVWYPAPLFDVVDGRVSRYWTFGFTESGLRDGSALFAFAEWARDPAEFYDRLTDGAAPAVTTFKKYRELMELEFMDSAVTDVAEDIGDGWLLCPKCRESWQSPARGEMVRCPQCRTVLRNPALIRDDGAVDVGVGGTYPKPKMS